MDATIYYHETDNTTPTMIIADGEMLVKPQAGEFTFKSSGVIDVIPDYYEIKWAEGIPTLHRLPNIDQVIIDEIKRANKDKAGEAQHRVLRAIMEDDALEKYSLPPKLTPDERQSALKYISDMQVNIDNPPDVDTWEPDDFVIPVYVRSMAERYEDEVVQ